MISEDKSHLFKNPDNIVRITNFFVIYNNKPYDLYIAIYIKKRTIKHNYIFKDNRFLRLYNKNIHRNYYILDIKTARKEFPQYFI